MSGDGAAAGGAPGEGVGPGANGTGNAAVARRGRTVVGPLYRVENARVVRPAAATSPVTGAVAVPAEIRAPDAGQAQASLAPVQRPGVSIPSPTRSAQGAGPAPASGRSMAQEYAAATTAPVPARDGAVPGEPLPPQPPLLLNRRTPWTQEDM